MTSQSFNLRFSPPLKTLINSNSPGDNSPCFSASFLKTQSSSFGGFSLKRKALGFDGKINGFGGKFVIVGAWREEGNLEELDDAPLTIELQQICSESQFDRVIAEAEQLEESLIILWMASWCRKCIYLKPKLEKLAADYHPRLRFYCVDVNSVPHNLVALAGVTKMPTIQLWRDGKKQAEMIGGHKAYLVVNEVRQMIENECTS
ncbi:Thioredoxin-like 3-1 [Hibiscus syriacus]|uniref:Thioredoxin-like 3-1 n=1 Tax=Hibiscus syriacus TaxID=106335 RepID=A0A6A2XLD1_HIBSY|nr:thioredoxin-like 3-2, chloroplastic [Hibiscus syriacus]KAE8676368.1 Thioredoxin-like 3-1 [Hibiscus syriacus]